MTYYKFLTQYLKSPYRFTQWELDKEGKSEWMTIEGNLEQGENGFHFCNERQLPHWINAQLFECEASGEIVQETQVCCAQSLRLTKELTGWNEQTQRLFAADCAARVLNYYESKYPNDLRPRNAIITARKFAFGLCDYETIISVADAAATAAAYSVADAAAYSVAHAAAYSVADAAAYSVAHAAAYAAYAAAYTVANMAANAVTNTGTTERLWQSTRLLDYAYGHVDLEELKERTIRGEL